MIACAPKIVISPSPTTGLPASSSAGSGNPFSAVLQAATQNLLHPSPKLHVGTANPSQKIASTQDTKTTGLSGSASLLNPNLAAAGTAAGNNSLPVQSPTVPTVTPDPAPAIGPATVDETKLQTATLGAEQQQSDAQMAGLVAANQAATRSGLTFVQQLGVASPQVGTGISNVTNTATNISAQQPVSPNQTLPELPQPEPKGTAGDFKQALQPPISLNPSLRELPQPSPKETPASDFNQALQQPMLSVAAPKQEISSALTAKPNLSNVPANQPGIPAGPTPHAMLNVPQAAGMATPATTSTPSAPSQTEHSGAVTESKNLAGQATDSSVTAAPAVPQIPLQVLAPDINLVKLSSKPADATQINAVAPASSAQSKANPALEVSKKNGDSGSGNTPSGTGKGNTSSSTFTSVSGNGQADGNSSVPIVKAGEVASSAAIVGAPAHTPSNTSDAPGSSVRTDAQAAADPLHSLAAGAAEPDARIQAAGAYANSLLHSARLLERAGQTELRVGLQTGEFGNVDIRTSMVRNQFTAQISVERGDLGKVLAAELPSLQTKLSEQRLPVSNITLQNQSSGGSAGFGQGSRQSQTLQPFSTPRISEGELVPTLLAPSELGIPTGRLDVHM